MDTPYQRNVEWLFETNGEVFAITEIAENRTWCYAGKTRGTMHYFELYDGRWSYDDAPTSKMIADYLNTHGLPATDGGE